MSAATKSFLSKGLPLLQTANPHASVGKWLLGTGGLVVGMIHVGGVTRLTQSGLSMTSWSPLGSLPPMTTADWEKEFARYKEFPEWQQRQSMTLSDFQFIYAWEYGHRMLGRMVGLVFVAPWAYFTLRGKIPQGYQPRMATLAAMGGTQGLVGWWMVKSGLGNDRRGDRKEIRVRPIRLTAHLTMAVATYGALVWTGMNVLSLPHKIDYQELVKKFPDTLRRASQVRAGGIALTGLTALTIVSGALVAGNDAGRAFNTFPKMDGRWIPSEIMELVPWQRNLIENTATVQWNHRLLGTTTAVTAASVAALGLASPSKILLTPQARKGLYAIGLAAAGQFTLGVTTLLYYVPLSLAAAHQVGSIVVFTSGLYLVHSLRYARPAMLRAARAAVATTKPVSKPVASPVAAMKPQ